MTDEDRDALTSDAWFASLPASRQEHLLARLRIRELDHLARVYRLGDPPDGLWVLLAGEVRLLTYAVVGAELVGMIVKPGRWFGELSVLDGGPRPHDAVAVRRARVGLVSTRAVQGLSAQDPEFWRDLARLNCAHQRIALAHIAEAFEQKSDARLATLLLNAMDKVQTDKPIRMNQSQLGAIVGVSRQRLNRLLARLAAQEVIRTFYGGVTVLDADRLRLIARGEAALTTGGRELGQLRRGGED